jgi:hypothetical protein
MRKEPEVRVARVRRSTASVLAWLLCLIAAVPYFGLIDLVTLIGWVDPEFLWPVPLDVSWGALFTFFLAAGYGWIGAAPRAATPGLVALVLGGGALAAGAVAGMDLRPLPIAVVVLVSAAGLAWLTSGFELRGWRVSWIHLVLAVLGAALWIPYLLSALRQSQLGTGREITNGADHWPVQAAAGLAILLGAVLLAVWEPGRPLLRASVGFAGGVIGVAALAYPNRDGATEGTLWAILAVLWALAVAAAPPGRHTERRTSAESAATPAGTRDASPVLPG